MSPSSIINTAALATTRTEVTTRLSARTNEIAAAISTLTIVNSEDYSDADLLLVRIRQARKQAEAIFAEKIRTPILEPMRKSLDALYQLEREMTKQPFDEAERTVKGKMGEWQANERRLIEEKRRAALEEERKREREAEEGRRREAEAERLAKEASGAKARAEAKKVADKERERRLAAEVDAETARQAAILAERAKPVVGVGSRVTVKKKAVVKDMSAFIAGVVAGEVPEILLQVNEEVMEEYWKADRGLVSAWPGVSIEDEVKVGGR